MPRKRISKFPRAGRHVWLQSPTKLVKRLMLMLMLRVEQGEVAVKTVVRGPRFVVAAADMATGKFCAEIGGLEELEGGERKELSSW